MNGDEPLTGELLALDLLNTLPHTAQGPRPITWPIRPVCWRG